VNAKLYGTDFCHLCDDAKSIINKSGVEAINIDIASDDHLLAQYGLRIPVLQRIDNHEELDWPFDVASVLLFLR
jgi:hypothetical protein